MNRILAAMGLCALLVLVTACSAMIPMSNRDISDQATQQTIYYLQVAQSGSLVLENGSGTLMLRELAENVVWVSDRPTRESGSYPLSQFAEDWELLGFGDVPPNAILESLTGSNSEELAVSLVLSNPEFDASQNVLSYQVKAIPESTPLNLNIELGHVALFIDSANSGTLKVTMQTEDGEKLPGAYINLESTCDAGFNETMPADGDGVATFSSLDSCNYTLTATMPGMQTIKRSVYVNIGGVTRITIKMLPENNASAR